MEKYQKFISEKAKKKREFMGKMFFPRKPILLLDLSMSKKRSSFKDLLEGLNAINLTTLVVARNGKEEAKLGNIHYIPLEKVSQAHEAADFTVVFSGDLSKARTVGCVPISQLDGDSTVDYNPLQQKGNGFYFKNPTKWEVFASIVRALETYQFPYDWENLIREVLS